METDVQVKDAVRLALLSRRAVVELIVQALQFGDEGGPPFRVQLATEPSRGTFQVANDPVQLAGIFLRQRRHGKAFFVSGDGGDDDIAFLLKTMAGGADRRATDAKPIGQVRFNDATARREFAVHDQFAQTAKRRVADVVVGPFAHHDHTLGYAARRATAVRSGNGEENVRKTSAEAPSLCSADGIVKQLSRSGTIPARKSQNVAS